MSQPTNRTAGEIRALTCLQGFPHRKRLEALTLLDLSVLREAFASGTTAQDMANAIKSAKDVEKVEQMISKADVDFVLRGKTRKLYVKSYMKDEQVQKKYPIPEDAFNQLKGIVSSGRNSDAVHLLQSHVNASVGSRGATTVPVVEFGQDVKESFDLATIKEELMALSPQVRSAPFTVLEEGGTFYTRVGQYKVYGPNKKAVGNLARCVREWTSKRMAIKDSILRLNEYTVEDTLKPKPDEAKEEKGEGAQASEGGK